MSDYKTYEIPTIARGKIIWPDENATEFGGRGGARFRCPNPTRHINNLLLSHGRHLADLANTPHRLNHRLPGQARSAAGSGFKRLYARSVCSEAGGMTEPVLKPIFEGMPALFDRKGLEMQIDGVVGKDYLDGWVEQGKEGASRVRIRAVGVVNLVPVEDIDSVCGWVSEETQTVAVYPEALRERLRDDLAFAGVQRLLPLGASLDRISDDPRETSCLPHDGIEPMRRMVRWIVDQSLHTQ